MFTIKNDKVEVALRDPDLGDNIIFERLTISKTLPSGVVVTHAPSEWPVPGSYSYRFQLVPHAVYMVIRELLFEPVDIEWLLSVVNELGEPVPFPHGVYSGVITQISWAANRKAFNSEEMTYYDEGTLSLSIERDGTLEVLDDKV